MSDMSDDIGGIKRSSSPQVIEEPINKKHRSDDGTNTGFAISKEYSHSVDLLEKLYSGKIEQDAAPNKSTMISEPFKVMELKDFLQDNDGFIDKLCDTISGIELNRKNNDLYSYKVSDEMTISDQQFEPLLNFLRNDVRLFLQKISKETLNEQVSVTVSRYDQTDYLLCHDDQLEGRKIAFVIYLVDSSWSEADGGHFEMFSCDKVDNQPVEIVRKLVPTRNALNFFVVAPNTYHQVSEILTNRSPRWSINGWFHADNASIVPRSYTFPLLSSLHNPMKSEDSSYDVDYELFTSWISSKYLIPEFQKEVRHVFTSKSEIQLPEFFNVSKYNLLKKSLKNDECSALWKKYFRPAFAKFSYLPEEKKKPQIVDEAIRVFRSEAFFLLLSQLTGIGLHKKVMEELLIDNSAGPSTSSASTTAIDENKPDFIENPICRGEVRKWQIGDYSLASNESPDFKEVWGLDVMLFLDQFQTNTILDEVEIKSKVSSKNFDEDNAEVSSSVDDKQFLDGEDDDDDEEDENFEISNKVLYDSESEEDSEDSDNDDEEDEDDDESNEENDNENDEENENNKYGGVVVYIDDENSEELMTFLPAENCLNIVYRTKGTQRFMKYLNSQSPINDLHEIAFVYTDGDFYKV